MVEGTLSASVGKDDEGEFYISGGVQGNINVPSDVPIIGGETIGQAGVYLNNDGFWGEGSVSLLFYDLSVACHVPWDAATCSSTSCLWDKVTCGDNLDSIGYSAALRSPGPYSDSPFEEVRFSIGEGMDGLVATINFEYPEDEHYFRLVDPEGNELTPGDTGEDSNYGYSEGNHTATFIVRDPTPGRWYAIFSGFYNPRFNVYRFNKKPTIDAGIIETDMDEVREGESEVVAHGWLWGCVCIEDEPEDDPVDVGIFYTNRDSKEGVPNGTRVILIKGMKRGECREFGAKIQDLPPGNYHFYTLSTDGRNVPKVTYIPITVHVVKDWDIPDPNLRVVYNEKIKGATLSWDEVPGVEGYRIYVSEDGGRTWTDTPAATDATTYDASYLKPGKEYLFAITGYDFPDDFKESNMTEPVSFTMPDIPCGDMKIMVQDEDGKMKEITSISPPPFNTYEPYNGSFFILNNGNGTLKIEGISINAPGINGDCIKLTNVPSNFPISLNPGDELKIDYTIYPKFLFDEELNLSMLRASIAIRSSDPCRKTVSIPIVATRARPKITVFPEKFTRRHIIDFESVSVGSSKTYTMAIENTGNVPLDLKITFEDEVNFSVDRSTISIKPCEMKRIHITFSPDSIGPKNTMMIISDENGLGLEEKFRMGGRGTNERPVMDWCNPSEVATVVGEEARFTCSAHDPDGDVTGYSASFGDGEKGRFETGKISHIYERPGLYMARVFPVDNTETTGIPKIIKVKVCPEEDLEVSKVVFPEVILKRKTSNNLHQLRLTPVILIYYDTLTMERQDVDHYDVAFLVDGEESGRISVPIRETGRIFKVVRFLRFWLNAENLKPGKHTLTVILDPDKNVIEENRKNNRMDFEFSVR